MSRENPFDLREAQKIIGVKNAEIAELQRTISTLRSQIKELSVEIAERSDVSIENTHLKRENEKLRHEIERLRQQYQIQENGIVAQSAQLHRARRSLELVKRGHTAREEIEALSAQNAVLTGVAEQVAKEQKTLEMEFDKVIHEYLAELQNCNERIEKLECGLAERDQRIENLIKENEVNRVLLNEKNELLAEQRKLIETLRADLTEAKKALGAGSPKHHDPVRSGLFTRAPKTPGSSRAVSPTGSAASNTSVSTGRQPWNPK